MYRRRNLNMHIKSFLWKSCHLINRFQYSEWSQMKDKQNRIKICSNWKHFANEMVILGAGHTQLKIFCEEVARIPILSLVLSQLKDTKNGIYRNQNYFAMKRATVILGAVRNLFSAANLTKNIIFCHKRDLFHQQTFIKKIS